MRRALYTLIAGAAIAAMIPTAALAQGHDRGHRRDNERQHRRDNDRNHRRHAPIRHRHFGRIDAPLGQNVGTVASFDGRTLAIRRNDGSTVSGAVNRDTEISCVASDRDHGAFDRNDGGPGGGSGDGRGDHNDRGDSDRGDDNNRGDDNDMRNCGRVNLRPGTVVHEADLRLSSLGPIWQEVELVVHLSQGQIH